MNKDAFKITFWGTRGTLPVSGPNYARTGGNTNCVEVNCGDTTLVIDAGTGVRELGTKLVGQDESRPLHLLLSHAHYDHVEGIPFFAPFFIPERQVNIYSGPLDGSAGCEDTIKGLMQRPFFPVGKEVFTADMHYHDVGVRDTFQVGNSIRVHTAPLNHPGGATGFRIEFNGKSFAYVTDTEHEPGKHDENVLGLIEACDLFVYDCSLTDQELPEFTGYGHSTHEEGLRLQKAASAGRMMAVHHLPFRIDAQLDSFQEQISRCCPKSTIARDGDVVEI